MLDGIPKTPVILEKVQKEYPVQRRKRQRTPVLNRLPESPQGEDLAEDTSDSVEDSHSLDIRV